MKRARIDIDCPDGRHLVLHVPAARAGWRLTELLRAANLPLNTRCGQRGLCRGCLVEVLDGADTESARTARACELRLKPSDRLRIRIPPRSLLAYEPQIVTDFRINVPRAHDPLVRVLRIDPQTLPAEATPAERIARGVARHCDSPLNLTPQAQAALARGIGPGPWFVTIARGTAGWLITDVADSPAARLVGAAIDVGTTTVALLLVDLSDGAVLARGAGFNQQIHLGDDVVTRITLCTQDPAMLGELQAAVAHRTIRPLLMEAAQRAGVEPRQIVCLSVTGNTTMLHLLAGVNPASMGVAPFTPTFLEHRVLLAGHLLDTQPMACAPDAGVHLMPGAAAYIGADLCAGIIASGLLYDDGPSLLVDVGTNGEVILKHGQRLLGCATAAGPAFEGAGLSCGIRAGEGAISRVRLAARPFSIAAECIGPEGIRPAGICGSAYIDFLAQGRRIGLLGPTGRFELDAVPESRETIVALADGDLALRLHGGDNGRAIVVSQRDVSLLLQAKAAIAAGIQTLLALAAVEPRQVRTLYLAGGFGAHMDPTHAIECGLLPGFLPSQIQAVGNSSLAGAYLALIDAGMIEEMSAIRQRLEVVELNLDPRFEERYIDALTLPDIPVGTIR